MAASVDGETVQVTLHKRGENAYPDRGRRQTGEIQQVLARQFDRHAQSPKQTMNPRPDRNNNALGRQRLSRTEAQVNRPVRAFGDDPRDPAGFADLAAQIQNCMLQSLQADRGVQDTSLRVVGQRVICSNLKLGKTLPTAGRRETFAGQPQVTGNFASTLRVVSLPAQTEHTRWGVEPHLRAPL